MSTPRLLNKTALITGGGAGIGAATARLFCQEGAGVMLVDADASALELTRQALKQEFPGAWVSILTANVSDGPSAQIAVDRCLAERGALNILVNNASMRNHSAAADATAEEWHAVVDVNLVGTANYCRAALPALRLAKSGCIVNISSCYAVTGRRGMGIYDATKAAQLSFTRTLAFEESENGVRVNAVCPGSTLTDFQLIRAEKAGKNVEQLKLERKDTSLIGRWATPEEIGWPIVWLASAEASFITGTTLMVDGGLHIM